MMAFSKRFLWAIGALLISSVSGSQILINEFDPSGPGIDTEEFVELFGSPNQNLSGFSLVIFNGSNAQSNLTIDLSGYTLNDEGFFLIGGPGLPNADVVIESTNWLQVGQEGIALYDAQGSNFPNGTPVTSEDLLDAVVYGNNQPPLASLLDVLTPGSVQLNESAEGLADYQSFARLPDGGTPLSPLEFTLQSPTPGYSNVLLCDGGSIALQNASNAFVCTDQGELVLVQLNHTNDVPSALFTSVITSASTGLIVATFEGTAMNLSGLGDGLLEVFGVSHDLPLFEPSLEPGQPVTGITGEGCHAFAYNSIEIQGETCDPPACDGGVVTDASGTPTALGCVGMENATVTFGYTSEAVEAEYVFVITDESQQIIDTVGFPQYDFTNLGVGMYQVWGTSGLGGFESTSLAPGASLAGITGIECDSLSTTFLEVEILDCESASFCEEIFISEYVEGNSNNKAIELYNPSPVAIDLTGYHMETWNNGSSEPTNTQELSGVIEPNDVFVIMNALAAPELFQAGDLVSQVTWFNGNDVIVLYHDGVIIDQMGEFGPDPGAPWTVDGGAGEMAEYTLVRKANVSQGSTDWSVGQYQWDAYPQDTFDFIGYHTATCTGTPDMELGFAATDLYIYEGGGTEVVMQVAYPLQNVTVQVDVVGGSATAGMDFPGVFPLPNFTFPIGLLNNQTFTFAAIDDEEPEGEETVELAMEIMSGEAVLLIDTITIHIQPSDLTYPVYDIATVRTVDFVSGVSDSLGVSCELRGIVHGWNDYPSGLQFTLIDSTDGINVFSPLTDFGYEEVVPGDSLRVRGSIGQFAGLTQLIADTVIYEGSGFLTEQPTLVQELNEETESHIIKLKCVELVDPAQWTNSAPSFEVDITTGSTIYTMRIDANTDLFLSEPPIGVFGVTGIGDQRDFDEPFFSGYRISPRYQSDISTPVAAMFTVTTPWNFYDGALEIDNLSEGAGGFYWTFGDGGTSDEENPEYTYTDPGTYDVILTAFSEDGNCSDQTMVQVDVLLISVDELSIDAKVWPNPARDFVFFESATPISFVEVYNTNGMLIEATSPGQNQFQLDARNWHAGVYVIHITTTQGSKAVKLIRSFGE
ncbi:MAG: lamin tail domain-containing protein [Bacteroidetes bacterium]|nr:lamin tail domain-containing protein [Bacteroidota bacterium]